MTRGALPRAVRATASTCSIRIGGGIAPASRRSRAICSARSAVARHRYLARLRLLQRDDARDVLAVIERADVSIVRTDADARTCLGIAERNGSGAVIRRMTAMFHCGANMFCRRVLDQSPADRRSLEITTALRLLDLGVRVVLRGMDACRTVVRDRVRLALSTNKRLRSRRRGSVSSNSWCCSPWSCVALAGGGRHPLPRRLQYRSPCGNSRTVCAGSRRTRKRCALVRSHSSRPTPASPGWRRRRSPRTGSPCATSRSRRAPRRT